MNTHKKSFRSLFTFGLLTLLLLTLVLPLTAQDEPMSACDETNFCVVTGHLIFEDDAIYLEDVNTGERFIVAPAGGFIPAQYMDLGEDDLVVARDARLSGKSLEDAFIRGFTRAGKNVTRIGMLPLGAGMYYAWKRGMALGFWIRDRTVNQAKRTTKARSTMR